MKVKSTAALLGAIILLPSLLVAAPKVEKNLKQVVFTTSMECAKCREKIIENVSFLKGVVDLDADLPQRTVTITFDENKTDTTILARSIRILGFDACVTQYVPILPKNRNNNR